MIFRSRTVSGSLKQREESLVPVSGHLLERFCFFRGLICDFLLRTTNLVVVILIGICEVKGDAALWVDLGVPYKYASHDQIPVQSCLVG
jgi:hypothetical protein